MEAINGKVIPKALPAGLAKGKGKAKAVEGEGRPVAVDWALSKDQWEKTKGPEAAKKDEEESGSGSDSDSSGSDSDSDSDSDEASDDEEEEEADGDVTMQDGEDDDDEEEEEPVKPTLPTVDVGSTLFIRNLPFEVTEQELNTL